MKKCTKIIAAAIIACMLSACGNKASQTQGDGGGFADSTQSQQASDTKEPEQSQEPVTTQKPEQPETPAASDDVKCTSSKKHFSSCEVTAGDGQLTINFVNNVPVGESDGFTFFLWNSANATDRELNDSIMDSINSWRFHGDLNQDDTTYTFTNLTNGQTYHLYADVYIDNWEGSDGWKYPKEGTHHDIWYIGAYTPAAPDNGKCTSAAKHFSACVVTPGNGQLTIDFINNVPVGESHEFYFYLLDSEGVRVKRSYAMDRDDTTYTFTDLTNGQTYGLYAFIDIDNWEGSDGWKFPEEGTYHDDWYVGAFTPAAN